ncbi:MAG: hypothetical protein Q8O55_06640 [Dehalococcoidales bacterium]|nr:hypothetical protein [Dehalococcoidales bacterium]
MQTSNDIKSLLVPPVKTEKKDSRKVWSVDLKKVWIPFFRATNANGETAIPVDAIGAPIRLQYDKAGQPRFSNTGRPVLRVAKPLSDNIKAVRDNFTANLISYATATEKSEPDAIKAHMELERKAGAPIINHDNAMISATLKAMAEAEAKAKAKAKADEIAKAEAEAKTEAERIEKAKAMPKQNAKQAVTA